MVARYAARVNGITDYFVTKLDVLSGLEQVPICVAYDVDGVRHDEMPMTQTEFHHAKPIYEEHAGLVRGHHRRCRTFEELPAERAGLRPAAGGALPARGSASIGVGPGRDENVVLHDLI